MKYMVFTVLLWNVAVSQHWAPGFTEPEAKERQTDFFELVDLSEFEEQTSQRVPDEFSEQVARLVATEIISEERLRAVPQVLRDLELVINTCWTGSRVKVFGSIEYGLAMTDSDADCTIFLPHRTDTSQALIEKASNALRQYPNVFTHLLPITWTRIPVLNFKHTPTQFKVDLTINNLNGVQISNLIRYLIRLDERIYKLAFVIKKWAAVHRLTGSQSMPNYGLILMVIFYLQQRNMMPSIASLQANANPLFESEWNLGFCEVEYELQNDVSLNLLLGSFFEYYVDFNYDKFIISPYLGYPVERWIFRDVDRVPYEFGLYVQNVKANVSVPLPLENAFVVQDVFIHNDNVVKYADTRPNSTFMRQFQFAATTFRQDNNNFLNKIVRTNN